MDALKVKKVILVMAVISAFVFLVSCELSQLSPGTGESSAGGDSGASASIPVYLTDKPLLGNIGNLYVDLGNVEYHYEVDGEGTKVNVAVSVTIDLLTLAGTEALFFDMDVPEGATLTWIQFDVLDATAVVSGIKESVKIPSGRIKIIVNSNIEDGDEFLLDFDVSQSLKRAGWDLILTPVVHLAKRNRMKSDKYDIYGVVEDGSGTVLPGIVVGLLDEDESTVLRTTLSKDDGSFRIKSVKNGTYTLAFYDFEEIEDEDLLDMEPATKISVTVDGTDVNVGTVVIPAESSTEEKEEYSVYGRVIDQDGSPVVDALVKLEGEEFTGQDETDEEGGFEIEDVPNGEYTLSLFLPGASEAATSLNVTVNGTDVNLGDIEIESEVSSETEMEKAEVSVLLTDTPIPNLEHLYVDIENIEVDYETPEGADHVSTSLENFDILALAGDTLDIADLEIQKGSTITHISFEVSSATAVLSDVGSVPVVINSGHVDINCEISVKESGEIYLDFDVAQSLSISVSGLSMSADLSPVAGVYSGEYKISGNVTDSSGNPVEKEVLVLYDGETPIRATLSRSDGSFRMFGVDEGEYTLKAYNISDVLTSDFGSISPDWSEEITVDGDEEVEIQLP
jgi:hypothetical protein